MYFQKIQRVRETLTDEHVVIVSLETPDGGKAGVMTEVNRAAAARLIVEGRARLAHGEERQQFHDEALEAKRRREAEEASQRMQIHVITAEPSREPKTPGKQGRA